MLPAVLTTLFFSLSAVTGNRCARVFGGIEANFYRLTAAMIFLGIYVFIFGTMISGPASTMFMLSGIVGVGCGDLLFFQTLPILGSRLTILLIQCLSVPIAAAIEWQWMGTSLTARQMIYIGVVLAGISIALHPTRQHRINTSQLTRGLCLGMLAAFGNGFGAVLSRKAYFLAEESGIAVDGTSAAFQRVLGGLFVGVTAVLIARWPVGRRWISQGAISLSADYKSRWRTAWPWVLATSLAGQTFGVTCFQWALKSHPTGVVLPIVALTPLVAVPVTLLFEGERPTLLSFAGAVIAVAGVIGLVLLH